MYVREVLGLKRAPEFERWLRSIQITNGRSMLQEPAQWPTLSDWMRA